MSGGSNHGTPLPDVASNGIIEETGDGEPLSQQEIHTDNSHSLVGSGLHQRKSAASSMRSTQSQRYPPDPIDAADRKSVLKTVAGYILVTEFCERLAYYGFAGSLVLFFQVTPLFALITLPLNLLSS